jgi:UTP-glucose-1-phosphate uridylyltransferase
MKMKSDSTLKELFGLTDRLDKLVDAFAQSLYAKQFTIAGYDLGEIITIGQAIVDLGNTTQSLLLEDANNA